MSDPILPIPKSRLEELERAEQELVEARRLARACYRWVLGEAGPGCPPSLGDVLGQAPAWLAEEDSR